jgi:hypothetical protein
MRIKVLGQPQAKSRMNLSEKELSPKKAISMAHMACLVILRLKPVKSQYCQKKKKLNR